MDNSKTNTTSKRKDDHIHLAKKSAIDACSMDSRFNYEPMIAAHPKDADISSVVFGKKVDAPFWVSSMTGGSERAFELNRTLAKMVGRYKIGMGLGSCRCLMNGNDRFEDFNLRPILGDEVPFFGNIGIAQLEEINSNKQVSDFFLGQLRDLGVDGLIIHVNPMQEWLQPEGDRYYQAPIDTIKKFIDSNSSLKIIVKEVGQGFGPASMKELLKLPISGVEFGAFGGTNFSRLEILRSKRESHQRELALVGHNIDEMISYYNQSDVQGMDVIISGGITNFLDGHYYQQILKANSVIGMAGTFLKHAVDGEEALHYFMEQQMEGVKFASTFLTLKERKS